MIRGKSLDRGLPTSSPPQWTPYVLEIDARTCGNDLEHRHGAQLPIAALRGPFACGTTILDVHAVSGSRGVAYRRPNLRGRSNSRNEIFEVQNFKISNRPNFTHELRMMFLDTPPAQNDASRRCSRRFHSHFRPRRTHATPV